MKKPDHWKQPTPAMQLIDLRESYEGRVSNICDCPGEIDGSVLASMADEFVEELKTLQPFLEAGTWEIAPNPIDEIFDSIEAQLVQRGYLTPP